MSISFLQIILKTGKISGDLIGVPKGSEMPQANMFSDKRAHSRVQAKIPVTYRHMDDKKKIKHIKELGEQTKSTQTLDTSLGGMYIVADEIFQKGSLLSLKIALPGVMIPISAFAEVAWSNETGAGLHFLVLKEKDLEALAVHLDKVSRQA